MKENSQVAGGAESDTDATRTHRRNFHDHHRTPDQVASLLRLVLLERQAQLGRPVTRARISQDSIRKLCGRGQLSLERLNELQEALLGSGWALFCVSFNYFAIVRLSSVEGWARISTSRLKDVLSEDECDIAGAEKRLDELISSFPEGPK